MTSFNGVCIAFWGCLGISVVLLVGITLAMIFFAVSKRCGNENVSTDIDDNLLLEVIWLVVPAIIIAIMMAGLTLYLIDS